MSAFADPPPGNYSFTCLDGHTCGNPVRLVTGGAPMLGGATMSERRQDFVTRFDWVRRALMYEPRGHDVMSGSLLYPPTRPDCDIAILFIEVSGCLPMCGHGTIGTVTMALENGLATPAEDGVLRLDTPAGSVRAEFTRNGPWIDAVRIRNVPSYLAAAGVRLDVPGLGELVVDIAYGGNFYAIVEPQRNYAGLDDLGSVGIQSLSPRLRDAVNRANQTVHPLDPTIAGIRHIMWTDAPRDPRAHARNAVFYGTRAIDRSPCGTGTSARMAQLAAKGELSVGQDFIHESIIGTLFDGRVEAAATIGRHAGIVPSIAGWARQHGLNTIFVNERDPLRGGFQLG
ncbi:MAG: 4-hydroxyproline epimerase [Aliidongia sp.]|jgi:4-hydroxyproline epimerase|nr:4-hydroxyproline epimerase [Aliidongia sp.]